MDKDLAQALIDMDPRYFDVGTWDDGLNFNDPNGPLYGLSAGDNPNKVLFSNTVDNNQTT